MKPNIHPEYRDVLFHDSSADTYFVIGSTLKTDRTAEYEGKTYPYYSVDVSSASHPFYTGKQRTAQNDGQIAKFNKRFSRMSSK
ncbi:type B 50S ribosomal protein L31 [Alteromonas sp. 5E99-2]|uniref:type B 50S ribosomal protein L31 n=1 Tax=Alteromonas sp. 5E99-2 TaxID=2817683 RepID=UPI001A999D7F|nr:type B 50S ribosomal protein L31 [Alteromonas sp. 5E99-2]MBO1256258.1 type B 50S ribosomal protein L31 [Alteromonas sp. 5E99-2]